MKEKIFSIEDILPENIKKIFEIAKFEKEILNFTKSLFNESIKKHCKPIYITNNILIIAVDNPLWASEILNYKQHLLNNINKKYNNYLKDIKSKFLPKYFIEKNINKKLSSEEKEFIEKQTSKIEDKELKEKLSNLIETFILVDKK
ncbi:MAG TPA: DciA family protein [Exilispira sp.]|nr:DciA family protein [Exilispira sp.]